MRRSKINNNLFREKPTGNREVNLSETGIENEAIYGILIKILEKWRLEIEAEGKELEETVILSPQEAASDAFLSPTVKPEDMDLEETIVSTKEIDRMSSKQRLEEQPKEDEFLEETVIVKPRKVRERDKDKVNG